MNRPTIEGLPSPAAPGVSGRSAGTTPAFKLDAVRSIRMRPRLAGGVALGVFLLVFGFGLSRKPMYTAESLTYIEPLASKVLSDGTAGTYDPTRYDSYLQQQMQTAVRPDILETAIRKLPPFVWQRPGESMQSAIARLQGSLKVQRVSTSYQLSISLMDANPENAAAVVNAVTNAYLEQGRKDEHTVADQRLRLLSEERQRIQQALDQDRVEQAQLGGVLGVANPTATAGSQYDTQIAGVQSQIAGAREAHDLAAAQYASLQGSTPALAAAADDAIAADSGLNSMKGTITQRKAVLSTQMAGLTPSNPIYKQDQAEIADLDRSLDTMTAQLREKAERRLQDKMRADLQRTADVEGRLNAQLAHQTRSATSATPKLQRAEYLATDIERLNARYTVVDDAMRGLELESNGPGSAHLSVAAAVPVTPEPSKRKLILLLSLPLAALSGLLAAVFGRRLDPKIYSGPDVEEVLGFLPIGVMPARGEVSGRVMEEYTLRLAAGLQSAYRVSSAQSFVFTAASASVQTSDFVAAMERILRSLGFKALVMDASSVLRAAQRTHGDAGHSSSSSSTHRSREMVRVVEGLRQGYAAEEIDRLKRDYDLLLIDAPPLLHSAETEYLVRCADATILIAESGVTVRSELYQSAVLLQQLNVAGVGAVLQELHMKDADPAFRAAIEAVERIQRSRSEGSARSHQPKAAEPALDVVTDAVEDGAQDGFLDKIRNVRSVAAALVPAPEAVRVKEPREQSHARPDEAMPVTSEEVVSPVEALIEAGETSGGSQTVPEPAQKPVPELREAPAAEQHSEEPQKQMEEPMAEFVSSRTPEPVLYFEDRLRPQKSQEPVASPAGAEPVAERVSAAPEPPMRGEWIPTPDSPAVAGATGVEAMEQDAELLSEIADQPVAPGSTINPLHEFRVAQPTLETEIDEELPTEVRFDEAIEEFEIVPEAVGTGSVVVAEPVSLSVSQGVALVDPGDPVEMADPVEIEEKAPEAVALAPIKRAARREPSAPRMEWVTLRFKGTTERVLRIVPADEEGEGAEEFFEEEEFSGATEELAASGLHAREVEGVTEPAEVQLSESLDHVTPTGAVESNRTFEAAAPAEIGTEHRAASLVRDEAVSASELNILPVEEDEAELMGLELTEGGAEVASETETGGDGNDSFQGEQELIVAGGSKQVSEDLHPAEPFSHEAERNHATGYPEEEPGMEAELRRLEPERPEVTPLPDFTRVETLEETPPFAESHLVDETVLMEREETAETEAVPSVSESDPWKPAETLEVEDQDWVREEDERLVAGAPVHPATEGVVHEELVSAKHEDEMIWSAQNKISVPIPVTRWRSETLSVGTVDTGSIAPPSADPLSPMRLVNELRSRSNGSTPRVPSETPLNWSRRNVAAPVEERLEPRAGRMTRRWEMLSRFETVVVSGGQVPEENATADGKLPASAEQGGR